MSLEPTKCAKCPTPIVWARAKKTGKPMPVDAAPSENGNIRLTKSGEDWIAEVFGTGNAMLARSNGESLHVSHFVTCPFSRDFKKPKSERVRG